jgi:hypothetical protein
MCADIDGCTQEGVGMVGAGAAVRIMEEQGVCMMMMASLTSTLAEPFISSL